VRGASTAKTSSLGLAGRGEDLEITFAIEVSTGTRRTTPTFDLDQPNGAGPANADEIGTYVRRLWKPLLSEEVADKS
jgi:hypothetical protein